VNDSSPDILTAARTTKDEREIAAIRRASGGTVSAMRKAHAFLASLRREGDRFRDGGRGPVTLGDVRRLIQAEFLAHGLAETGGDSIVSQGRDAGVPHNRGNDADPLRAGMPILIDIFPGEVGGGYCSDLTRTYCLGTPPDALRKLYEDVWAAFRTAMDALRLGESCRSYQDRVCELFEQRGHATRRTNETTEVGYVHNLGHGVGLSVHEGPLLGGAKSNAAVIEAGMAITIEPGLYYPGEGLGVRVEDLVIARPDGTFENLTAGAPYDLVIEPRG
jgi:Xaa-Pro aminopeptidase